DTAFWDGDYPVWLHCLGIIRKQVEARIPFELDNKFSDKGWGLSVILEHVAKSDLPFNGVVRPIWPFDFLKQKPSPLRVHQSQGILGGSIGSLLGYSGLPDYQANSYEPTDNPNDGCFEVGTIERGVRICLAVLAFGLTLRLFYYDMVRALDRGRIWRFFAVVLLGSGCFILTLSLFGSAIGSCSWWRHII